MPQHWVKDDVHTLAKALRHRDPLVRRHAAGVLGGFGDGAAAAAADLGRVLADPDPDIAGRAARALGRIGAEGADYLTAGLVHAAAPVRREAIWALKELGASAARVLPAIIAALDDVDVRVQLGAAQVLGMIGPAAAAAIPALAELLQCSHLILCRLAAQALARIGESALPALRMLREGTDRHARREAAWAMNQIEEGRSHGATSDASQRDPRTQVVECLPQRCASHVRTALIAS